MHIAIDLRSLQSGSISGVENYTLNLLEHLLPMDSKNKYTLFYNAWGNSKMNYLHVVNSEVKRSNVPNKFLNAGLKLKATSLEKLIGNFDCLFMPNLNQYNILPGKKLVLTVHDLSPVVTPEFYDYKRRLWHKFLNYRHAFERADRIFAVSEYTKLDLMRLFDVPERKIRVTYPGIDHARFHPNVSPEQKRHVRNMHGLPGEYILFLSTVEPRKNLSNLIQAFDAIPTREHLVIVGRKGWKYRQIFEDMERSKKRSKIHYIGYIPEEDKPAVVSLARVVAYPSFYEGFGFVPLEAAACAVPALVSHVTSLPEVMGDAAVLVNPYQVEDMAKALALVLGNESLRGQIVAKGLERVKKFSWEKTAAEILEGLNSLVYL